MRGKFPLRAPSPAVVVSLAALFVALGGTSYAASTLPKNSVGAKQLKNGAVTTPKVKHGAVTEPRRAAKHIEKELKNSTTRPEPRLS